MQMLHSSCSNSRAPPATNRRNAMRRAEANAKRWALDFEHELCSICVFICIHTQGRPPWDPMAFPMRPSAHGHDKGLNEVGQPTELLVHQNYPCSHERSIKTLIFSVPGRINISIFYLGSLQTNIFCPGSQKSIFSVQDLRLLREALPVVSSITTLTIEFLIILLPFTLVTHHRATPRTIARPFLDLLLTGRPRLHYPFMKSN